MGLPMSYERMLGFHGRDWNQISGTKFFRFGIDGLELIGSSSIKLQHILQTGKERERAWIRRMSF